MLKAKIISIIILFLILAGNCFAQESSNDFDFSIRLFPAAFIEYEGEGARDTENITWESKFKAHNFIANISLYYKLSESSDVNFNLLSNNPTLEHEMSSSGLQFNDVIMQLNTFCINYRRNLADSGLKGIVGFQYLIQSFDRSNFKLYPDQYVDFEAKEVIQAEGLNFGIAGRYFSPVYLDFEVTSGFLFNTQNRQTTELSELADKGYMYNARVEIGIKGANYCAGIGAMRGMYHPQVKGGASKDGVVCSYSQNKTDIMGIYFFGGVNF